eukprot:2182650-Prymnesium_polylepis.1
MLDVHSAACKALRLQTVRKSDDAERENPTTCDPADATRDTETSTGCRTHAAYKSLHIPRGRMT